MNARYTARMSTSMALIALAAALCGCGGGGGTAAPAGPSGPTVTADYYVDPIAGNDSNPGSWESPFRTLTYALSVAVVHERIHAVPGLYTLGSGEDFPLVIPDLVQLIGDAPNQGVGSTATILRGGGLVPPQMGESIEATVVMQTGSALVGFVVNNPNAYTQGPVVGIALWKSDAVIRDCHVLDCYSHGVHCGQTCLGGEMSGCVVARNQIGLHFHSGPDNFTVEYTVITGNQYGAMCVFAEPDFGGGGSNGGNWIVQNTEKDLSILKTLSVMAQSNYWDNVAPHVEVGVHVAGTDIYLEDNSAAVNHGGAMLNTVTFVVPVFP